MERKASIWKGLSLIFLGVVIGFLISPIKGSFLSNNSFHWGSDPRTADESAQ